MGTTSEAPSRRRWLKVAGSMAAYGMRIQRAAEGLEWEPFGGSLPFSQGYAIRETIKAFRMRPSRVAVQGGVVAIGDESYALLGIEAEYANARVRLYVLDRGSELVPLFVDEWMKEPVAA